jgi:peptidyl-tRNA hydrolase
VLGRFTPEEMNQLEKIIAIAEEAAITILCNGAKEGMNRFNRFKTIS